MTDRRKSMGRVLAVQRQIVRLTEWRLGVLKGQRQALKDDQEHLHAFVSSEEALSPLLSAAAFDRGRTLMQAVAEKSEQAEAQSRLTDTMRRRERLAEKLVDKLQAEADRAAERRRLQEAVEASMLRDGASFP